MYWDAWSAKRQNKQAQLRNTSLQISTVVESRNIYAVRSSNVLLCETQFIKVSCSINFNKETELSKTVILIHILPVSFLCETVSCWLMGFENKALTLKHGPTTEKLKVG